MKIFALSSLLCRRATGERVGASESKMRIFTLFLLFIAVLPGRRRLLLLLPTNSEEKVFPFCSQNAQCAWLTGFVAFHHSLVAPINLDEEGWVSSSLFFFFFSFSFYS